MEYLTYDALLENCTQADALDYARGMVWSEIETNLGTIAHADLIDTIGGVGVWYDYCGDHYFFTDEVTQ